MQKKEFCKENLYLSQSSRSVCDRVNEHKAYVRNKRIHQPTIFTSINQDTTFNSIMKFIILEKIKKFEEYYCKEK